MEMRIVADVLDSRWIAIVSAGIGQTVGMLMEEIRVVRLQVSTIIEFATTTTTTENRTMYQVPGIGIPTCW